MRPKQLSPLETRCGAERPAPPRSLECGVRSAVSPQGRCAPAVAGGLAAILDRDHRPKCG